MQSLFADKPKAEGLGPFIFIVRRNAPQIYSDQIVRHALGEQGRRQHTGAGTNRRPAAAFPSPGAAQL